MKATKAAQPKRQLIGAHRNTPKQRIMDDYKVDWWIATEGIDNARSPQEKRAYAILQVLVGIKLKELEK